MNTRADQVPEAVKNEFRHFMRCAEEAPAGTYEKPKAVREMIGEMADQLMANVRELGLEADNCDGIFAVEAAIYGYIKGSNPESTLFSVAEGFGEHVGGDSRARVLANCERDMAAIRAIGMAPA